MAIQLFYLAPVDEFGEPEKHIFESELGNWLTAWTKCLKLLISDVPCGRCDIEDIASDYGFVVVWL